MIIGVIGAMQIEIDNLKKTLKNWQRRKKKVGMMSKLVDWKGSV